MSSPLARRRTDHREALQTHHAGQDRTLPPDPVPLTRQTTLRRYHRAAAIPSRCVRPHLQHPQPAPRPSRTDHSPASMGRDARRSPPRPAPPSPAQAIADDIRVEVVQDSGSVEFKGIKFGIGRAMGGHRVCIMDAGRTVMIFDLRGTLIIEHRWPIPGTTYVFNRQTRGPRTTKPSTMSDTQTVTDVLSHHTGTSDAAISACPHLAHGCSRSSTIESEADLRRRCEWRRDSAETRLSATSHEPT